MTGYRDKKSDFALFGTTNYSRPLRPYNWVQWTGVGLSLTGIAIDLVYFAQRLGWVRAPWATPTLALGPIIFGIVLVNSRRTPVDDPAPELAAARRWWLIVITIICAAILGIAAYIDLKGA